MVLNTTCAYSVTANIRRRCDMNKAIADACRRLADRERGVLNAGVPYRIEKCADRVRLYHYGTYLGGVKLNEGRNTVVIGYPVGASDERALNTVWEVFDTKRRIHISKKLEYNVEVRE